MSWNILEWEVLEGDVLDRKSLGDGVVQLRAEGGVQHKKSLCDGVAQLWADESGPASCTQKCHGDGEVYVRKVYVWRRSVEAQESGPTSGVEASENS